jgi:hypothetical protein
MANTNVFTGGDGTLTLAPLDTPPGQDAESIIARYEIEQAVGRVTGVRVAVETDLKEFFEIGFRHVTSLHEGDIHIRGEIDRAYINGALLGLLLGRKGFLETAQSQRTFQPEFNLTMDLDDPATVERARLSINGIKFKNWTFSMPEDEIVMEQVSFIAKSIDILDIEGDVTAGPVFIDNE